MLVKVLMDIDPLPMRGSLVMTIVMISPSWREVSPAEQLCQSPRLVPPRFRLVAVEYHPESWLMIFFLDERPHIAEDGHRRATRGPMRQGARPGGRARPHPRGQGVAPLRNFLRSVFFIYSENDFCEVSGLLEMCIIGLQYLLLFQPRIPAAGILPLHVNLVK